MNLQSRFVFTILVAAALSACVAGNGSKKLAAKADLMTSSGGSSISSSSTSTELTEFKIIQVTETTAQSKKIAKISFYADETSRLPTTFGSRCPIGSTIICECVFTWRETNTTNPGSSVTSDTGTVQFERRAIMPLTNSQPWVAQCEFPSAYAKEIGVGEEIRVSIVPVSGHQSPFKTNEFLFVKPGLDRDLSSASFEDDRGNLFHDIWRYTCHDVTRRGVKLSSKSDSAQITPPYNSTQSYTENVRYAFASQFAFDRADSSSTPVLSAQLNYYNLYVPQDRVVVNASNSNFSCPSVSSGTLRTNVSQRFFPFDSSFALPATASKIFNVPVVGRSRLSVSGSSDSSANRTCSSPTASASGSAGNNEILSDCLGFAASPKSDGSCPNITIRLRDRTTGEYLRDGAGAIKTEVRPTYRLRRFTALYPPMYDTNGEWISNRQGYIDQIFVLDRPAQFVSKSGQMVRGTMYGPKPCPFAWWDRSGVTNENYSSPLPTSYPNLTPSYRATNDPLWKGKNPDGIQLPSINTGDGRSCPAILPYNSAVSGASAEYRIKSLNWSSPEKHIRPIQNPWEPTYLEDTAFLACAPEDEITTRVRAPLHHYSVVDGSGTASASYCEEVYPTEHHGVSTVHSSAMNSVITNDISDYSEHYPLLAPLSGIQRGLLNTAVYGCQATSGDSTLVTGKAVPKNSSGIFACCSNVSGYGTAHKSTCSSM